MRFPCQIVFALVVTLIMAVLLLKLQPFVVDSDDSVSTMAQWVLFMQVFAGLLTKIQSQQACSDTTGSTKGSFDTNALAYVQCSAGFTSRWGLMRCCQLCDQCCLPSCCSPPYASQRA